MTGVRALAGVDGDAGETMVAGGFGFALVGWLLGVGLWDYMVRGWFGLELRRYDVTGWRRYISFDTDHMVIGVQYLLTMVALFFIAGLLALLMRWELASAGRDLMSPSTYNSIMSLHGAIMIFVAVVTIVGGFGNYIVTIVTMRAPGMNGGRLPIFA